MKPAAGLLDQMGKPDWSSVNNHFRILSLGLWVELNPLKMWDPNIKTQCLDSDAAAKIANTTHSAHKKLTKVVPLTKLEKLGDEDEFCFKYVEFADSRVYTWKCPPRSHANTIRVKEI